MQEDLYKTPRKPQPYLRKVGLARTPVPNRQIGLCQKRYTKETKYLSENSLNDLDTNIDGKKRLE